MDEISGISHELAQVCFGDWVIATTPQNLMKLAEKIDELVAAVNEINARLTQR